MNGSPLPLVYRTKDGGAFRIGVGTLGADSVPRRFLKEDDVDVKFGEGVESHMTDVTGMIGVIDVEASGMGGFRRGEETRSKRVR